MKKETFIFVIILLYFGYGNVWGADHSKRILALYSYDATFHIYQESIKALKEVFPEPTYEIDVDFLDSKRFPNGELNQNLLERIKIRQKNNGRYDLIISGNDNALTFCIDNQNELFPEVPVIFWGVNDLEKAFAQDQNPYISGIAENISADKLLTVIQTLHPNKHDMVILADDTKTCIADLKIYREALSEFKELNAEIVHINDMTTNQFCSYLRKIPPEKIILLLAAYRTKDQFLNIQEIQNIIIQNTGNIVYNANEFGVGAGYIGGTVKNYFEMMYSACLWGKQVLNGTDIQHLKVIKEPDLKIQLDYAQLTKRHVNLSLIPHEAILTNTPQGKVEIKKVNLYFGLAIVFFCLIILMFFVFYINTKRQFEKALRVNAENYLGIFRENLSIMLIINPEDGKIIDANEAATNFYGYNTNEFKQLYLKDIDILPQHDLNVILHRFESGESYIQVKHRLKNKQIRDVELYAGRIRFGSTTYLYAIIHDISNRIKANNELLEAKRKAEESDRLKSAFLANMSHEIRTPMNSILGFSSLLEDSNFGSDTSKKYLRYIQKNGEHLLKLINDIIDLSKIEANQLNISLKDCNLNMVLDEILVIAQNQLNLAGKTTKIRIVLTKGLTNNKFTIITDEIRLKQIFINLLNNAIKFTDVGEIEFGYKFRADSILQFFVKDTGIGIPEDKRKIIFTAFGQVEEYATRNHGGTGLGLSITRSLVEKMGGHIWVVSDLGVGSRFYFTHPTKDNKLNL